MPTEKIPNDFRCILMSQIGGIHQKIDQIDTDQLEELNQFVEANIQHFQMGSWSQPMTTEHINITYTKNQ